MSEEKEMSFLDHMEELRWHVVRSTSVIFLAMIGSFVFIKEIFTSTTFYWETIVSGDKWSTLAT